MPSSRRSPRVTLSVRVRPDVAARVREFVRDNAGKSNNAAWRDAVNRIERDGMLTFGRRTVVYGAAPLAYMVGFFEGVFTWSDPRVIQAKNFMSLYLLNELVGHQALLHVLNEMKKEAGCK